MSCTRRPTLLLALAVLGCVAVHEAGAQPPRNREHRRAGASSADQGRQRARRRTAATLDALDRVLREVHRANCAAPQSVEIQLADRVWIVTVEWEQPAKIGEWTLDADTGRVVRGPCVTARRRQRQDSSRGFVRAIRAAANRAPRYQSAPERFQIGVAWLPGIAAFQVDFFLGDHAPADSEVVLVDGKSFRVLDAE